MTLRKITKMPSERSSVDLVVKEVWSEKRVWETNTASWENGKADWRVVLGGRGNVVDEEGVVGWRLFGGSWVMVSRGVSRREEMMRLM